jgi:hypothetical protein
MQICTVSGIVTDPDGRVLAGAQVSISKASVAGAIDASYHLTARTDSDGAFSFRVPFGARIRFASDDVASIDGWNYTVPNKVDVTLGVFRGDTASEVGARDISGAGAGPSGATVVVVEKGDDALRKTYIRLVNHPVTVGNSTGVSFGGSEIYEFPEGRTHLLGCTRKPVTFNLTDAGNVTPIDDTMGGDVALGTTDPDDGTMAGTDVDINPSTSIDPISGGAAGAVLAAAAVFDGTSTPVKVHINILIDDLDVADGASDVILVNCDQILLTWTDLGDTA